MTQTAKPLWSGDTMFAIICSWIPCKQLPAGKKAKALSSEARTELCRDDTVAGEESAAKGFPPTLAQAFVLGNDDNSAGR
jgi:hypothetical protein